MKLAKLFILMLLLPACVKKPLTDVPLVWKPTDAFMSVTCQDLYNQRIRVMPFNDKRQTPREIGRNVEDATPRLVTTKDDVGAWVSSSIQTSLRNVGVQVTEANPTLIMKGDINAFSVNEDSVYRSIVSLRVSVTKPNGKAVWQGVVNGSAERFGRSYKAENYYETLSDGLNRAIGQMISDPAFCRAL